MNMFWALVAIAGVVVLAIVSSDERRQEREQRVKLPLMTYLFWMIATFVGICVLATMLHATDINSLNPCLLQGPKPTAPSKQIHAPKPTPASKQIHAPVPQKEQPADPPVPLPTNNPPIAPAVLDGR